MYARVIGQLWMERADEHPTLTGSDDVIVKHRKNLNLLATTFNVGSTDEGHGQKSFRGVPIGDSLERTQGMETAQLSAIGIAKNGDVHAAEVLVIEQNHACTSTESRQSVHNCLADRCKQTFIVHDLHHSSALATGETEAKPLPFPRDKSLPVIEVTDKTGLCPELPEHLLMLEECALQG